MTSDRVSRIKWF